MSEKPELACNYLRKTIKDTGLQFDLHKMLLVKLAKTSIPIDLCVKVIREVSLAELPAKVFDHLLSRARSQGERELVHELVVSYRARDAQAWLSYIGDLRAAGEHTKATRVHQRAMDVVADKTLLLQQ